MLNNILTVELAAMCDDRHGYPRPVRVKVSQATTRRNTGWEEHAMSPSQAHLNGEPRVEDLLNDPIMAILLRYDGLEQEDVRQAMERAAAALKRRAA